MRRHPAEGIRAPGEGHSAEAPAPRPASLGTRIVAGVILAALLGAVGGGLAAWAIYQHFGPGERTITQFVTGPASSKGETIGQLAQSEAASVVSIATQPTTASGLAGGNAGFADGVVVSSDGLILTSAHAVKGATQLRVGLADGRGFDAVIAGTDSAHGLVALRALDATGLTPISLASAPPSVGDAAIAVFRPPEGQLSVTVGTVSAIGQTVTTDSVTGASLTDAITVDATAEPGADGAPVINSGGQLIGVISTVTGATAPPGITALSLTAARALLAAATGGTPGPSGSFGAEAIYLDPAHAAAAGLPSGALVEAVVPGGPASQAGLQPGDIVTGVDGVSVDATHPFDPGSLGLSPGESAVLTVVRGGGSPLTVLLVVGTGP